MVPIVRHHQRPIIWLVGYMGAGKSTVGAMLAERLSHAFVDTDNYIEQCRSRSIVDLIDRNGWSVFRCLERMTCLRLAGMTDVVIATGGGLPVYSYFIDEMKQHGIVIYLHLPIEDAWDRVQGGGRPLAQTTDMFSRTYEDRRSVYEMADLTIPATGSVEEVADRCLKALALNVREAYT